MRMCFATFDGFVEMYSFPEVLVSSRKHFIELFMFIPRS